MRALYPSEELLYLLSGGAEGHRNDCFAVTLQGAGAAGHSPDPEDSLGLVDDVYDPLCLHCLGLQSLLQRGDNLGIVDIEGQG
jgi:hypothetical protein